MWITCKYNDYFDFPHVAQEIVIECGTIDKNTGVILLELVYGITSQTDYDAYSTLLFLFYYAAVVIMNYYVSTSC